MAKLRALSGSRIGWCLFAIFAITAPRALDAAADASRDEPAALNHAGGAGAMTSIDSSLVIANYWFLSMIVPTTLDGSETLGDGVIWGNGAIWDDVAINAPIDCGMSMDSATLDVTSPTILWYYGSMCSR